MSTHYNNVAQAVSGTPGTGTITLASAVTGAQTLGAAAGGNATVDVFITDGSAWEVARNCTYTHSGTTLTRGTLEASSTGSALSLTSAAVVRVAMPASTGNAIENKLGAWGALDGENSITGTATAVIGRLNVCSGTSADYTVTLPAVSGNAGRYIGFRMASGLTKLVTLDGNASETIDGALTRVMRAQETALLYCDGTTWTKMAGKTIPFKLVLQRSSVSGDQEFSSTTWTACQTPETMFGDAAMYDSTNHRIKILRNGTYTCSGSFYVAGTSITVAYGNVGKNQAAATQVLANIYVNSTVGAGSVITTYECVASDYIVAAAYVTATSPRFETDAPTTVAAVENVEW